MTKEIQWRSRTWVVFYRAGHQIEAQLIRGAFQQQGLEVMFPQSFLSGGLGELPGAVLEQELFCQKQDFQLARNLITEYEKKRQLDWYCSTCNEVNGSSFDWCWNCQSAHSGNNS
ncbi:DUF2007 domain-containing protein [Alginatibacterium sediminis]|uniref:DUF2007 domain-containing protein n=1 Tax=Alginatibacterium sediminis TaxID=2164068 RepID=A0A420ELB8_9ALTE|nr:DUF2007 domain-containing protein [Alginatibacterium sediminis]RKF21507.1 DUF2007 domain-containing protein [Alginatibacterium sediminis]